MMQIACQWCGHRYTMKRDALANAIAVALAANAKHHVEHCPKCRKVLKIPISDLKRRLPPGTPLPEARSGADVQSTPAAAEEKPKSE